MTSTHALLTSQQPEEALAVGTAWSRTGDDVVVVLLDAATAILRPGHEAAADVETAQAAGVRLWAHIDAVAERNLELRSDIEPVELATVASLLGDPATKAQWW